ncbi:MAG: tetratricopeptide repeat protein, partial [Bacteroidota bacterium]|nr:tetratricopeptide repeat protein [Bacteroidota bacterium]
QQDRNKARVICEELLNDPAARNHRAQVYYQRGLVNKSDKDFAAARSDFEAAMGVQPESRYAALAGIELALLTADEGALEDALTQLRAIASTRVDAVGAEAQYRTGELLAHARRYAEAREALLRVGYVFADDASLWNARSLLSLGRINEAEARNEEARRYYEKVITQYGGSDEAREAQTRREMLK